MKWLRTWFVIVLVGLTGIKDYAESAESGVAEGSNLPGGLNLRIQRRRLVQANSGKSTYNLFSELQHYRSAFLYFPAPYTVQYGDTLESLALHSELVSGHPVSVQDIQEMNSHLKLPAAAAVLPLRLGLNIPGYPAIPPPPTSLSVADSATLLAFLQAYGISSASAQAENPGLDIEGISKMTTVRVPDVTDYPPPLCSPNTHCVVAGETLSTVAQQLGQPVEELLLSNGHILRQGGRLFIGQALTAASGPVNILPPSVVVPKFRNPYQVLLSLPGLPMTPAFLSRLAKANKRSLRQMLEVNDKDVVLAIPSLREMADPTFPPADVGLEDSAPLLEQVEPLAPTVTSRSLWQGSAPIPGYRRRVLHPLLKPIASDANEDEDEDDMLSHLAPVTHTGALTLGAQLDGGRAPLHVEDATSIIADTEAQSSYETSALPADYIRQFAQTVFGSGGAAKLTPGGVDDDEADTVAVALDVPSSVLEDDEHGIDMSALTNRAVSKMSMERDVTDVAPIVSSASASHRDAIVRLLTVLKAEVHDPRVDQMLEEILSP